MIITDERRNPLLELSDLMTAPRNKGYIGTPCVLLITVDLGIGKVINKDELLCIGLYYLNSPHFTEREPFFYDIIDEELLSLTGTFHRSRGKSRYFRVDDL